MACRAKVRKGSWMVQLSTVKSQAPRVGAWQFGHFKTGLGVGATGMDDIPKFKTILELIRGQSLTVWGMNLCFARRQRVARPNWAYVFIAGFFKRPFLGWKNWQLKG